MAVGFQPAMAGENSFQGMCRFFGSGSYDRSAGLVPQKSEWSVQGTGICTGTLNGSAVRGSVTFEEVLVDEFAACTSSFARGQGALHFNEPTGDVEYVVIHDVGFERRMDGSRDGTAFGFLTAYVAPPPQPSPLDALAQCASGELQDFNFEMDFMTLIPLRG